MRAPSVRIVSIAWTGLAALLAAGCMGLPEDRAHMDEEVGIAEAGGVAVRVVDGLAAVRQMDPGKMVLWAQSPVLEIDVSASASAVEDWTLIVENCLADAELIGRTAEGASLVVTPTAEEHGCPTHRAWTVHMTPGLQAKLWVSSPDATVTDTWRFAVVNDPHGAEAVRAMVPSLNADARLRMVVSSGDISGGSETGNMLDFQQALRELRVPFYSTVGNNDAGSSPSRAWHDVFGRHSFHFAFRGVDFSFVDSASASVAPLVYEWMDGWLQEAGEQPHVLLTHVPPLDPLGSRNGGFRSRAEAGKFLGKLARAATDLVICGHIHVYYDLEEAGIPTVISGAHGQYAVVDVDPVAGSFASSRMRAP